MDVMLFLYFMILGQVATLLLLVVITAVLSKCRHRKWFISLSRCGSSVKAFCKCCCYCKREQLSQTHVEETKPEPYFRVIGLDLPNMRDEELTLALKKRA